MLIVPVPIPTGEAGKLLLEKVARLLGAPFIPWYENQKALGEGRAEVTRAEYEVKAAFIREQGRTELDERHRRTAERWVSEQVREQLNMESIIAQAIPQLEEGAKPEEVDDDWLAHFLKETRQLSNEQMQALFARVLAGEANSPGRFSRRTVRIVTTMEKRDAELFRAVCRFAITAELTTPLIFNTRDEIYTANGIDFPSLLHLEEIGLLTFNHSSNFGTWVPNTFHSEYFGTSLLFVFPHLLPGAEVAELPVGKVALTQAGKQIALLCGATPVSGFVEYLTTTFAERGVVMGPLPQSDGSNVYTVTAEHP